MDTDVLQEYFKEYSPLSAQREVNHIVFKLISIFVFFCALILGRFCMKNDPNNVFCLGKTHYKDGGEFNYFSVVEFFRFFVVVILF